MFLLYFNTDILMTYNLLNHIFRLFNSVGSGKSHGSTYQFIFANWAAQVNIITNCIWYAEDTIYSRHLTEAGTDVCKSFTNFPDKYVDSWPFLLNVCICVDLVIDYVGSDRSILWLSLFSSLWMTDVTWFFNICHGCLFRPKHPIWIWL